MLEVKSEFKPVIIGRIRGNSAFRCRKRYEGTTYLPLDLLEVLYQAFPAFMEDIRGTIVMSLGEPPAGKKGWVRLTNKDMRGEAWRVIRGAHPASTGVVNEDTLDTTVNMCYAGMTFIFGSIISAVNDTEFWVLVLPGYKRLRRKQDGDGNQGRVQTRASRLATRAYRWVARQIP